MPQNVTLTSLTIHLAIYGWLTAYLHSRGAMCIQEPSGRLQPTSRLQNQGLVKEMSKRLVMILACIVSPLVQLLFDSDSLSSLGVWLGPVFINPVTYSSKEFSNS